MSIEQISVTLAQAQHQVTQEEVTLSRAQETEQEAAEELL